MPSATLTKSCLTSRLALAGRVVEYRLVQSKSATRLRVRVGVNGVEVIRPAFRNDEDIAGFLRVNGAWILGQLERVERFGSIRRPKAAVAGRISFRGELTTVRIEDRRGYSGTARVTFEPGRILITRSSSSLTPPAKSLENWLRRQARSEIAVHLAPVLARVNRQPGKLLVMGQRTKWGNCSALRNLSFNWRLIMAPDFVFRYLVTHEAVHLAVPDHSQKFWLTVRSLCSETERAKQWLCANGRSLLVDLDEVCRVSPTVEPIRKPRNR